MACVISLQMKSQDRVILRSGKVIPCQLISVNNKEITYRDTSALAKDTTMNTSDVLMTEYQSGGIYTFSKPISVIQGTNTVTTNTNITYNTETRAQRKERLLKEWKDKEVLLSNNIIGFYIPEIAFGRLTVSYERLIANKSIGITIPVSLTYDALGALAEFSSNNTNASNTNTNSTNSQTTTSTPKKRNVGTGVIAGIDINYYHDLKPRLKYFFGPRVRYGTDMALGGIEGFTFQLQNGLLKSSRKRTVSSIAIGFGFAQLSENYARSLGLGTYKHYFPWASFTWRLGFRL